MLLMKSLCNLIIKISPKGIPYLLNILKFPSKSTIYLSFVSSKNISNSISLILKNNVLDRGQIFYSINSTN